MTVSTVFSGVAQTGVINTSDGFNNATAVFIQAPLLTVEVEIDIYLQVAHIPLVGAPVIRNCPLSISLGDSLKVNQIDTEIVLPIPFEFSATGLQMGLAFVVSQPVTLTIYIAKKTCTLETICENQNLIFSRLDTIDNTLANILAIVSIPVPVPVAATQFMLLN